MKNKIMYFGTTFREKKSYDEFTKAIFSEFSCCSFRVIKNIDQSKIVYGCSYRNNIPYINGCGFSLNFNPSVLDRGFRVIKD